MFTSAGFQNLIYNLQDRLGRFIQVFTALNSLVSIGLLIYRYGYKFSDLEALYIIKSFDICFLFYIIGYIFRTMLELNTLEALRKGWFEAVLTAVLILHGLIYYTSGFQFGLFFIQYFHLYSASANLAFQHLVSFILIIYIILDFTRLSTYITYLNLRPSTLFVISFLILMFGGGAVLALPDMTTSPGAMPYLDAVFTATSACCVTGLATVAIGSYFTFKGQVVILLLVQIGGIGIISFATFFAFFLAKGIGIKQQSMIQDVLSSESLLSAKGLLMKVFLITVLIEGLGALGIYWCWDENLRFQSEGEKIFYSIFHSVSAFCNAGFSLFRDGLYMDDVWYIDAATSESQLTRVRYMYGVHLIIAFLIIFGGLGFSAIEDMFSYKLIRERWRSPWKTWKMNTKMSYYPTLFLLLLGTVGFFFLEFHQLTDRTIIEALITSFFQSVTTRTAGFNTMNFDDFHPTFPHLQDATIILVIFLMFIGACPGSTAGGIKTTTFYLILLSCIASVTGKERVEIYKRTIPNDVIQKAFTVLAFAVAYNIIAVFILSITELNYDQTTAVKKIEMIHVVFEQISAFGTVGLSLGITADLTPWGKSIIILSMFIGRVGTLTLAFALSSSVQTNSYRYPDDRGIMVG